MTDEHRSSASGPDRVDDAAKVDPWAPGGSMSSDRVLDVGAPVDVNPRAPGGSMSEFSTTQPRSETTAGAVVTAANPKRVSRASLFVVFVVGVFAGLVFAVAIGRWRNPPSEGGTSVAATVSAPASRIADDAVTIETEPAAPVVLQPSAWASASDEVDNGGYVIGRHSLIVDGIPFSFSVPASGWEPYCCANLDESADAPTDYYADLRTTSVLVSKSDRGPQGAEALILWAGYPDGTYADPCGNVFSEQVPRAAAKVAAAPGVELISGPSGVTVGGVAAQHVEVVVREDVGCDPGFFYNWKAQTGGALWETTELGDTIEVWIVDVDGKVLFIAGETHPDAGTQIRDEIDQIVASIRFD